MKDYVLLGPEESQRRNYASSEGKNLRRRGLKQFGDYTLEAFCIAAVVFGGLGGHTAGEIYRAITDIQDTFIEQPNMMSQTRTLYHQV